MKAIIFFICLFPFGIVAQEQNESARSVEEIFPGNHIVEPPKPLIYTNVDQQAEFPGGTNEMMKFIAKNIRYPEMAFGTKFEGKVNLRFVVDLHGSISNVVVLEPSQCSECDMQAIRLVKGMPKWKPARIDGSSVSSYYVLPVVFCVD